MRSLESILRGVSRPLPSVADARAKWRAYRQDNGYSGEAKLFGPPLSNAKLAKSAAPIYGLTLLPADASGVDTCTFWTEGCRAACVLMTAGRGVMSNVRKAREVKTLFAVNNPAEFLTLILNELDKMPSDAVVRLNVASDIRWERVLPEAFQRPLSFYDYTKWPTDKRTELDNYRIVYSRNERDGNDPAEKYLSEGGNVAVVFDSLPDTWKGFPVINGDEHDDRTLEAPGTVIGLKMKGKGKLDDSGFVVRS